MSLFPHPAKTSRGFQPASSQTHHFLKQFKRLFNDIFMRSAAQLAFWWGWLAFSGNCQYLPNGGQTPEQTLQLVEYPMWWLDVIFLCVYVHAPPACYHIWRMWWWPCREPVVPGEPKGSQAVSSSLGQQKPFQVSHSWKSLCAGFT